MTKVNTVIAAALAFALLTPGSAMTQDRAQAQSSALLPDLSPENLKAELAGDKPAFIIISGKTCDACPALAKLAAEYRDVKFYHGSGSAFELPTEILPVFFVNVPVAGVTIQVKRFAPADLEKFVARRVQFAVQQTAVALNVRAIREKIKTTSQPFDEELKQLLRDQEMIWKPYAERIAIERAKADQAAAAYFEQADALELRLLEARNPVRRELQKIRKETDAAVKANPLNADEAARPFRERTRQLELELDSISLKFKPEFEELNGKIAEATKLFLSEASKIESEGNLMIKPHLARIDMANANKERALAPLRLELSKSMQELEKALDESTPESR
jgi:hypothetical protein